MQKVTFDVETITPLFLSGADQNTAELRAPSLRGLMHYWQRALVGGMVGTDARGLEQVKEAETAVFGATDTGSAVAIRVTAVSSTPREFTEPISVRVGGKWQATGKGYLLWSMRLKKPPRYYFPPETEFEVHLSTRGADTTKLRQGIGSRSRRCAGSLIVQNIQTNIVGTLKEQLEQKRAIAMQDAQGNIFKLSFEAPQTANNLKTQLEDGIRAARLLYSFQLPTPQNQAHFDVLAPGACRIWILQNRDGKPWSTLQVAMDYIGNSLQNYRGSIRDSQHRGQIYDLRLREIFGLPLGKNEGRRASPLHLRIAELQDGRYVGIAVLFKTIGRDFSTGRNITMKDYKLIENWITDRSITDFPHALEVSL